jgi:hypothetical protein
MPFAFRYSLNSSDASLIRCGSISSFDLATLQKTGIFLKKSLCQPYKKFKISAIIHQKFLRANVNENFGG